MRTVSHQPELIATFLMWTIMVEDEKSPGARNSCTGKRTRIYWAVSGSRLIYVIARLPCQLAFGFLAVASGEAAFLVNRMSVFIGLAAFNVNPLPAD
jgi:hypothetical protein